MGGLLCSYAALRAGMVGLVAPIISTEGAIAALLAIVAGEPLTAAAGAALALIALGVALAGASPSEPDKPARRRGEPQVVLLAAPPRSRSVPASTPPDGSAPTCRWCGRCCRRG